jgi:hypothetical protein
MPWDDTKAMQYIPWCLWQQTKWHNDATDHDEVGYVAPTGARALLGGLFMWATGCSL